MSDTDTLVPFDPDESYGVITGGGSCKAKFIQGGRFYNAQHKQCRYDGSLIERFVPPEPEPEPELPEPPPLADVRAASMPEPDPEPEPELESAEAETDVADPGDGEEMDLTTIDIARCTIPQLRYLMECFGQPHKNKSASIAYLEARQRNQVEVGPPT